jgi:hypothetical protein
MSYSQSRTFPRRRPKSICVLVGQDSQGNWVAVDCDGKWGGLFATRQAARKYALDENGNRTEAIEAISTPLELVFDRHPFDKSYLTDRFGKPRSPERRRFESSRR